MSYNNMTTTHLGRTHRFTARVGGDESIYIRPGANENLNLDLNGGQIINASNILNLNTLFTQSLTAKNSTYIRGLFTEKDMSPTGEPMYEDIQYIRNGVNLSRWTKGPLLQLNNYNGPCASDADYFINTGIDGDTKDTNVSTHFIDLTFLRCLKMPDSIDFYFNGPSGATTNSIEANLIVGPYITFYETYFDSYFDNALDIGIIQRSFQNVSKVSQNIRGTGTQFLYDCAKFIDFTPATYFEDVLYKKPVSQISIIPTSRNSATYTDDEADCSLRTIKIIDQDGNDIASSCTATFQMIMLGNGNTVSTTHANYLTSSNILDSLVTTAVAFPPDTSSVGSPNTRNVPEYNRALVITLPTKTYIKEVRIFNKNLVTASGSYLIPDKRNIDSYLVMADEQFVGGHTRTYNPTTNEDIIPVNLQDEVHTFVTPTSDVFKIVCNVATSNSTDLCYIVKRCLDSSVMYLKSFYANTVTTMLNIHMTAGESLALIVYDFTRKSRIDLTGTYLKVYSRDSLTLNSNLEPSYARTFSQTPRVLKDCKCTATGIMYNMYGTETRYDMDIDDGVNLQIGDRVLYLTNDEFTTASTGVYNTSTSLAVTGTWSDVHYDADAERLFISGSTKIGYSDDEGLTWTTSSALSAGTYYVRTGLKENILLGSSSSAITYYSTNSGLTWSSATPASSVTLKDIQWSSFNSAYIGCGTNSIQIYNFDTNSWSQVATTTAAYVSLTVHNKYIYVCGNLKFHRYPVLSNATSEDVGISATYNWNTCSANENGVVIVSSLSDNKTYRYKYGATNSFVNISTVFTYGLDMLKCINGVFLGLQKTYSKLWYSFDGYKWSSIYVPPTMNSMTLGPNFLLGSYTDTLFHRLNPFIKEGPYTMIGPSAFVRSDDALDGYSADCIVNVKMGAKAGLYRNITSKKYFGQEIHFSREIDDCSNTVNLYENAISTSIGNNLNTSLALNGSTITLGSTTDGWVIASGFGHATYGNMYMEGIVSSTNTTNSTGITNGSLVLSGGAGIAGSVTIGGTLTVNTIANINTVNSTISNILATNITTSTLRATSITTTDLFTSTGILGRLTVPTLGYLGETKTTSGTVTATTNNVVYNLTSMTVGAGVWLIIGGGYMNPNGTGKATMSVSTVSATHGDYSKGSTHEYIGNATYAIAGTAILPLAQSASSTVYLCCSNVTVSGTTWAGRLTALRIA